MFLDARRTEYVTIHRSIPLVYAPYLGAEALRVYLLYIALASSEGHAEVTRGDVLRFLGISQETLEAANETLETYHLVQMKRDPLGGSDFVITLLPPPALPEEHAEDFHQRALPIGIEATLPKPASPRRATRRSGLTPAKLVTKFYRGLQRSRIDSAERELAKAEVADLKASGYSLEDIDHAIQWTLANREMLVQPVESFVVIRDTIDQALAAREEAEVEKVETAMERIAEEDHLRRQQEMIRAFRQQLTPELRQEIRQKALAQIAEDGSIVQELVTESFIQAKEDAIILTEYMKDSFE